MAKYYALSSDGETKYVVTLNHAGGAQWCTCIGFKFNHKCKHSTAVEADPSKFERADGSNKKEMAATVRQMLKKAAAQGAGHAIKLRAPVHTGFVKPMLAKVAERKKLKIGVGEFAVEVKYNGHRLIVLVKNGTVVAWSRRGKLRKLPKHLREALGRLPDGVYDGEIMAGSESRSWSVTDKKKEKERLFVAFDIITYQGEACHGRSYDDRREFLEMAFSKAFRKDPSKYVLLSASVVVDSWKDVEKIANKIWKADGEGVMIKRRSAKYQIGTRSGDMLKLKNLFSGLAKITGFKAKKSGPVSIILAQDAEGIAVKVRNPTIELRRRIGANPKSFIGTWFRFDYAERTPDGKYFHPRFDRFEKE